MNRLLIVLGLFYISTFLNAAESKEDIREHFPKSSLIDTDGLVNTIIGGHVNALSGSFLDSHIDLQVDGGLEPLTFFRHYTNGDDSTRFFGGSWDISFPIAAYCDYRFLKNSFELFVKEHSGGISSYTSYDVTPHKLRPMNFYFECPQGYTNCGSGRPSGKTNLYNSKVFLDRKSGDLRITDGGMNSKYYLINPSCLYGTQYAEKYRLSFEKKSNGTAIKYKYNANERLTEVQRLNANKSILNASLKFGKHQNGEMNISASNGQWARYKFQKLKQGKKEKQEYVSYLSQVETSHHPIIYYNYEKNELSSVWNIIEKKIGINSQNFLQIEYFRKGDNHIRNSVININKNNQNEFIHKVKTLKNCYGVLYDFKYDKDCVDVFDAEMHKISFISENNRLKEKIYYSGISEYSPISFENYHWTDGGQLKRKTIAEPTGNIVSCLDLVYDHKGNVIKETFSGYLDGSFTTGSYSKYYEYSNNEFNNLVKEWDDDGPVIVYHYKNNTSLPTTKYIICDNQTTLREFRFYNDENLCWLETYDDGAGEEHENFYNVTERVMLVRRFSEAENCYGKPAIEIFLHWDPISKKDIPHKLIKYTYDAKGQLISTQIFDGQENFQYCIEKRYDDKGRVIYETDPEGAITEKVYDEFGNLEILFGPDKRFHTRFIYDQTNRLVSTCICGTDGTLLSAQQRYNALDQVVSSTNYLGQRIEYRYDSLGRLCEKYCPAYLKEHQNGFSCLKEERRSYDVLNNPIQIETDNGVCIQQRFTSRNTIAEKTYPDGSTEISRYSLGGRLISFQDRKGITTVYSYDKLGNKLTEERIGTDSQPLSKITFTWKGKRLQSITKSDGSQHFYKYDTLGRCIEEIKDTQRVKYAYDNLGRCAEETLWQTNDEVPLSILKTKYNFLDRVTERATYSGKGELQAKETITYDMCGREIVNSHYVSENELFASYTTYDILGRAIIIEDACGRKNHIQYFAVKDPYNEGYLELRLTTDCMGRTISELRDPYGRTIKVEIKNSLGVLLSARSYAYNNNDKRTECIESIVQAGLTISEQIFRWKYDPVGNLLEETRAFGSAIQQTTQYCYFPGNLLSSTLKPDGNEILCEYDNGSRLKHVHDTYKTISYNYTYDALDRINEVEDNFTPLKLKRSYNVDDKIIEETFCNDLKIQLAYDPLNHLRKVVYPDQTSIEYIYNGSHLEKAQRYKNNENASYAYTVQKRSFQKGPLVVALPGKGGIVEYTYNPLDKIQTIHSDQFKQSIRKEDNENKPLNIFHNDPKGSWDELYGYDDLGFLIYEQGCQQASYTYDSIGNRIIVNGKPWTYNENNQLLSTNTTAYSYNANGNLQSDGSRTFLYDALDRLVSLKEGNQVYIYQYDEGYRRLKKIHYDYSDSEKKLIDEECYFYVNENEVGACSSNGTIRQLRVLADGIGGELGATIAIEIDNYVLTPIHDQRGSIRCLINIDNGKVEGLYRYDSFGNTILATGSIAEQCPWRFSGKRTDPESQYVYFGSRYYNPATGRWITLDPIGFDGGSNGYIYANNRPYCLIDVYGQYCAFPITIPKRDPLDGYSYNYLYEYRSCGGLFNSEEDFWTYNNNASVSSFKSWHTKSQYIDQPGKVMPNFQLTCTNGMDTTLEYFGESLKYTSDLLGGYRIQGTYNATIDRPWDLFECLLGFCGQATQPAKLQVDRWKDILSKDPNHQIMHICHSQGVLNTELSLRFVGKDLAKRIHIVALAPAKYIDRNLCGSVVHFAIPSDYIPKLDWKGKIMAKEQNTFRELDEPTIEDSHSFRNDQFANVLRSSLNKLLNNGTF